MSSRGRTRAALAAAVRGRPSSGFRASGILLVGVLANIAGSYAYNLFCIRWLGTQGYGDVAALTAIATIALLPLLGVQAALAREVAAFQATGNAIANAALLRLTARRTLFLAGAATFVLLAASPLIQAGLNIESLASVIAMALVVGTGTPLPITQGFLQGLERFSRIAFALVVYGFGRPIIALPLVLGGLGVAGALSAAAVAGLIATAIALIGLRDLMSRPTEQPVDLLLEGFTPVILGLLAFSALTNADVIAAKVFLSEDAAGTYAAASLVGKLAALVPAGAIAPVLLPRAMSRIERGEDPSRLVAAAVFAAATFGVLLTLALLAVPESLVIWAFGEQFGAARDLLAPCAAVMTLYGVINVNLTFSFALRDHWLVTLMLFAVVGDILLLGIFNGSAYQILGSTAAAGIAVIALHELRSPAATWRLLRT
jgi:O-antigen/teichoic acid export membrane protein